MKRFIFNKLIRNKLKDRMELEGIIVNDEILSLEEYLSQLNLKLLEEAKEVTQATSKQEITIELADVLEVIHALCQAHEIKLEEVEEERIKKRELNGFFDSENYIHYIEVEPSNKKVIDYLKNKKRPYVNNED